jgi:hypothetical protein
MLWHEGTVATALSVLKTGIHSLNRTLFGGHDVAIFVEKKDENYE